MNREMVVLSNIKKTYGTAVALDIDALSVRPGEFMTLLGASGSGKTTLLNVVAGTVKADSGTVVITGRDVTNVPPAGRELGMVFQNYALFPHMTVFNNIAYPLRVRRIPKPQIQEKVANALEMVRLPGMGKRFPKELSGGQQQRVSIARCLVYSPSLILMDEPLGALDKNLREQMQQEIKRLHAELGITILSVTHDQEEALAMSDRICLLRSGRIEQLGTPDELYFQSKTEYVANFLGESNFISARVENVGAIVQARTPTGALLELQSSSEFVSGQSVKLMIRPEQMLPDSASNPIEGVVDDVVFVGGTTTLVVRLSDESFLRSKVLTTTAPSWRRGQSIRLGFASNAPRVFSF